MLKVKGENKANNEEKRRRQGTIVDRALLLGKGDVALHDNGYLDAVSTADKVPTRASSQVVAASFEGLA